MRGGAQGALLGPTFNGESFCPIARRVEQGLSVKEDWHTTISRFIVVCPLIAESTTLG